MKELTESILWGVVIVCFWAMLGGIAVHVSDNIVAMYTLTMIGGTASFCIAWLKIFRK